MEMYAKMTLEELIQRFQDEVVSYDSSFVSGKRFTWMYLIEGANIEKLRVISGYLMAMKDYGQDIGDLKVILEFIIEKISK